MSLASVEIDDESSVDIVVLSIGTASLRTSVAVAQGLGVPVEVAVQAIYRAPALLIRGVAAPLSRKLCATLSEAGLRVAIGDAPPPATLFDVAAHFTDPLSCSATAAALCRLTGMVEASVLEMLLTPPGVVLGGVSAATVDALRTALPQGVELMISEPMSARFQLVLDDSAAVIERGVHDELKSRGIVPLAARGVVATDLEHGVAQQIWQRFRRTGALRLVNQAFLRFSVVVGGPAAWTPEQAALLQARADIPAAALIHLAGSSFAVEDGLTLDASAQALAAYAAVGLDTTAELTTFRHHRLEIVRAADHAVLAAQLAAHGLSAPAATLPFTPPEALPETRARLVRALLEGAGAEVYLADADG